MTRKRCCMACGYVLEGLCRSGICPECARPYDLRFPSTHSLERPAHAELLHGPDSVWRPLLLRGWYLMPAVLAVLPVEWIVHPGLTIDDILMSIVLFAIGLMVGYRVRPRRLGPTLMVLVLMAVVGAGAFSGKDGARAMGACAMALLAGAVMGWAVRIETRRSDAVYRAWLP